LACISLRCLKVLSPFWTTSLRCCDSSPTHNHSGLRSIQAITMAATSPIDSIWRRTTTRFCRLSSHRPVVVLSCQLVVPLLSSSHCAALSSSLSCRASWLLHHLSPSSHCAALSPSCHASCHIASRPPLVAPPCRRLVVPACCCIASPRPLVAPRAALSSSRPLVLSSSRPLVLSSRRLVVASPLNAPPSLRLIVSCACR
jgi:hypothetical protein